MTVEQHDVVDFVGVDTNGTAVLIASDHLSWDDVGEHLFCLQEKMNAYLRFIESGEIYEKYPNASGRPVIISVVLKFPPPSDAQWFFTKTAAVVEDAGFRFQVRQISN